MNKLFLGIIGSFIVIVLLLLNIVRIVQQSPRKLGVRVDASLERIASSTVDTPGTFFRANGALNNNNDGTGTTTLLTFANVYQADVVEIGVRTVATTTPAGDVKFKVEVSQDASLWSPIAFQETTNTGTQQAQIFLNGESASTTYSWGFTVNGTTTMNRLKFSHIAAAYLRVRAWATATTSILVEAFKLSQ